MTEDQLRAMEEVVRKAVAEEVRKPRNGKRLIELTDEQIEMWEMMLRRERAFVAIGWLGKSAGRILVWVGTMIALWIAFRQGLLEWISAGLDSTK